jgi:ribonuclease H2 subunit A
MSDVPSCCQNGAPVTLGIDEAGRGSILGPMTYGTAYWPTELAEEMEKKGFDDSKALTHEVR